jgi:hypothetical protein
MSWINKVQNVVLFMILKIYNKNYLTELCKLRKSDFYTCHNQNFYCVCEKGSVTNKLFLSTKKLLFRIQKVKHLFWVTGDKLTSAIHNSVQPSPKKGDKLFKDEPFTNLSISMCHTLIV